MDHSSTDVHVQPPDKAKIKKLWRIALYLGLLTAFEFVVAFTLPGGALKIIIFILMTIVKAYYIVSEFMHLGHEVKGLIWSILLPIIFILWLIGALIMQGGALQYIYQ